MKFLEQYGIVPLDYAILENDLKDYSAPGDKIRRLEQTGKLIRLKKGLFLVSAEIINTPYSNELVANYLYGPSYISFESALRYHGLIPERTFITKSVTVKRKKQFKTPIGDFEYIKVPEIYFPIGLQQKMFENQCAYIIASPEKALCDLVIATSGLRFQSKKSMVQYLFEDLRIDEQDISKMDASIIGDCSKTIYKKKELNLLQQFVYELKRKG